MFEVNGVYANRKGEYTVLELNPPKMRVRYKDGTEAELRIDLQERIWDNISAEYEARAAASRNRAARRLSQEGNYYIKAVSIPVEDDLGFPGWAERVVMAPLEESGIQLQPGDRLIFYAIESQTFFAVATITGEGTVANPKDFFFTVPQEQRLFFPIDIDTFALKLENGAPVDSVELESQPRFKRLRVEAEAYYTINEDDFELLAEALTEVAEEEDLEEDEELLDDDLDDDDED